MTAAEARERAARMAISLIEPRESLVYAVMESADRALIDTEIREIKAWLLARSKEAKPKKAKAKGGG